MSKTLSSEFLLGHVIALTYAVNSCIKHHPKEQSVLNEIATQLNALSISVLEKGAKDTADGVERIRMALISHDVNAIRIRSTPSAVSFAPFSSTEMERALSCVAISFNTLCSLG